MPSKLDGVPVQVRQRVIRRAQRASSGDGDCDRYNLNATKPGLSDEEIKKSAILSMDDAN